MEVNTLEKLIKGLVTKIDFVKSMYGALFYDYIPIIPIPFWGNITKAKIITVGINPSAEELKNNGWNSKMAEYDIYSKLIRYFEDSPHEWFETWEKALEEIGFSYKTGTAAHIDICPWATKSISTISQEGNMLAFERLLSRSLPVFYQVLKQCLNVEYIVLAGAATKSKYLNEFLYDNCISDCRLLLKPERKSPAPYINKHIMKIGDKNISALSCSVSPSARGNKKEELILKIKENRRFFIQ